MNCNNSVITNMGGIPYISTTNTTVGTEAVDFALGFIRRPLPPVGYFTVRITNAIPTGTTGTLPITLTLNGSTRSLTNMDGTAVTAADITGTGVLLVFNDRFNGVLQLMNVPA
jgi:hypothetical protein